MGRYEEIKKNLKKNIERYEVKIGKMQDEIIVLSETGESEVVKRKKEEVRKLWKEEDCYIALLRKVLREERKIKGEKEVKRKRKRKRGHARL